jgi:hypothetical protein
MRKQIENILYKIYGVSIVCADPTTILWAAEQCDDPKKALKAANSLRRKYGQVPAYAPYGHVAF